MIETLNKYLIQHKSINIPGLGTIFIEQLPAVLDVVNKRILPPHYEFRFNKYLDTPDEDFFSYLSYEKGIPDYEAIQQYNQFAQGLRNSIKQDNKAEWNGVGVFTQDSSGEMIFEPVNTSVSLHASVPAVQVLREKATPTVLPGEREKVIPELTVLGDEDIIQTPVNKKETWWMYALILFVIALVVMIVHFYQNGFNLNAAANRQAIEFNDTGSR